MNAAPKSLLAMVTALLVAGLAGCSPAPIAEGISDPHENANRKMFEANLAIDGALIGPVSQAYGTVLPPGVQIRVSDFAANTGLPSVVVNNLLQGRVEDAVHNTVRFVFNTTIGLGGLFDVATGIGLEEREADFGQTLHTWGVAEGDYVVLPVLGPSTERDAAGTAVDFFTNPLTYALPSPERYIPTGADVVALFGDRYAYGATFEEIMYLSEDGYMTARLYYLENRRYELGGGESGDDLYDLYEEAYE